MRRYLFALLAVLACTAPAAAQRLGPPANRPRLRDVTDTNDAQAYYQFGLASFERDPDAAADAFYWAARINPAWGEAVYARRAALIMRDRGLRKSYFERGRTKRRNKDLLRIDSLQFRALLMSPFLYQRLERTMFNAYLREEVTRQSRMRGGDEPMRTEIDFYIEQWLRDAGPWTRAWLAYSDGNFPSALRLYASALGDDDDQASAHLERARIFGMRSQVDSAVAEFDGALTELRKRDDKDLVVFYNSKALAEYSKAVLLEGAGKTDAAREAYSQALTEDLSYYPAHMRLGLLAMGARDTTAAVNELALATQLAGDDPHVHYVNGYVLATIGHIADAEREMKKSVELEPFYALPYLGLGQLYERLGKGSEAIAAYEAYLAHASQTDPQREYAVGRLAEVKDILGMTQQVRP